MKRSRTVRNFEDLFEAERIEQEVTEERVEEEEEEEDDYFVGIFLDSEDEPDEDSRPLKQVRLEVSSKECPRENERTSESQRDSLALPLPVDSCSWQEHNLSSPQPAAKREGAVEDITKHFMSLFPTSSLVVF